MMRSGILQKKKPRLGLDSGPREEEAALHSLLGKLQHFFKSTYFELKINLEPFITLDQMDQNYVSQKDLDFGPLLAPITVPSNDKEQKKVDALEEEDYLFNPNLPKIRELNQSVLKKLQGLRNKRKNKSVSMEVFARTLKGYPILMNRLLDEKASTGLSIKKAAKSKLQNVVMDQEEGKENKFFL